MITILSYHSVKKPKSEPSAFLKAPERIQAEHSRAEAVMTRCNTHAKHRCEFY